jgi:hypothetical protein
MAYAMASCRAAQYGPGAAPDEAGSDDGAVDAELGDGPLVKGVSTAKAVQQEFRDRLRRAAGG